MMAVQPNCVSTISWLLFCSECRMDAMSKLLTVFANILSEQEEK